MSDEYCDLLCLDLPKAEGLRRAQVGLGAAEAAASRFAALSDPTRLRLAASLDAGGELCVCDLAWVAERSQNLVSHHLRRLRTEGLVSSRRAGKMVLYAMTDEGRALLRAALPDLAEASR